MLTELHIEHLGVIERLDLVLGRGLTVLTGETGAGKTMLVEAISLLVGGRADAAMVRAGAQEARVEGRFVVGDDEYGVARVIPADGRSRAYVNGRLATAGNLVELGHRCVDLHGQHAHQRLVAVAEQRDALDRWCRTDLGPLRAARARLTEIDASLAALGGDTRARAREVDLLRFQVAELAAASIAAADEDELLQREHDTLADALEHRAAGERGAGALADDGGSLDGIGAALRSITGRSPFSDLEERLRGLSSEIADVAAELRDRAESIDEDPARLEEVRSRLQLLRDLRRKYGDTLADVLAFDDEAQRRLAELEGYEHRVTGLEREREQASLEERAAAAAVGAARRAGTASLGAAIESHLHQLAMPHASLQVAVGDEDPGDDVQFLLAANPGAPLLPLSRVASGGELARTMLALRLVLTEAPDTLLFDEVDAGIGGAAAVAVGRSLAELGERHQVLVVTHLAQVAAFADAHVVVSKRVDGGVTVAEAIQVDGPARVDEVARMLSGGVAEESARRHAAELLGGRARRQRT
ncbi:MAG: DNA repair protein RecN [Ilumatobacteraceae bacterium]